MDRQTWHVASTAPCNSVACKNGQASNYRLTVYRSTSRATRKRPKIT